MAENTIHTTDAVNLTALLPYNPDKFQTQLLSQKEGVKLILFAFAKGQELKTHSAPVEVILVPLAGQASFTLGFDNYLIQAGEVYKIPPHEKHALKALTDFHMLLIK